MALTKNITNAEEEWVWITGYKGTDKNMKCRDYQYEMNTQFNMPDDEIVSACRNGFHLCRKLENVFGFYSIGSGNRFFEVRALVRKTDADEKPRGYMSDKIAAKSIEFVREMSIDEILTAEMSDNRYVMFPELELSKWSDEAKKLAIETNLSDALRMVSVEHLQTLGYSRPFAIHIIELGAYSTAVSVGSQSDLSMDMKAMYIYAAVQREHAEREYRSRSRRAQYAAVSSLNF